jgi:FMN phosphatase YigB (HAD superfamily)
MIRVVMLDLGGTLEAGGNVIRWVPEVLDALASFVTAAGDPVECCLVSDFPFSEAEVAARLAEYLAILDGLGLRRFFQPVEERVTLSVHADLRKPDRRVFERALERLKTDAPLDACLFITENAEHVAGARALGMQALRFGAPDGPDGFPTWPEGLLPIAETITPGGDHNARIAREVIEAARGP